MVYRDRADDPEIARLQALIATRGELRVERGRIRAEHDRVAREADVIGRALADAEQGGALAAVSAWLTGSKDREREVVTLREQLSGLEARLETLVVEERVLDARLVAIDDAEGELEQRKAARAEVLRTQGGPIADELRAIDRAIAGTDARLADLEDAFTAHHRAESLVVELVAQANLLRSAGIIGAVEQLSFEGAVRSVSKPELRGRLANLLPMTQDALTAFLAYVDARDDISTHMAAKQLQRLASAEIDDPVESSLLAEDAGSAATCLQRLLGKLLALRDQVRAQRSDLLAQRASIEDSGAG